MKLASKFPVIWNPQTSQIRQLVKGEKDVIDLGFGEVNFDTPAHVKEAAKMALDDGFTHYAFPPEGIKELRDAIAEKLLKDNNIRSDPDSEIVVTVGGQLGIHLVISTLVDPGDEVIVSDPCFMIYPMAIQFAGGVVRYVAVREDRDFRMDPEDIKRNVNDRTKLIVLVSPDNPTGSCLTREDLERIAEIALENNIPVLCDEMYEKYTWGGRKHVSMASIPGMKDQTITLSGFSKGFAMTGWRIGYVVASKSLMDNLKSLNTLYILSVTSFVQKGAVAALKGPQKPIVDMISEYESRMNLMVEGLNRINGITCRKPWGSFYVYPNIKAFGVSSFEFAKHIAVRAKVLLHPSTAFGTAAVDGYLRISLSVTREEIAEALKRIDRAVASLRAK